MPTIKTNMPVTRMGNSDFIRLGAFIMREYGIKMPPEKKVMLQSRLQKRLKALAIDSFTDYIDYLFSQQGQSEELVHMVDLVSTNKTDFFRENAHFDFLNDHVLPAICRRGALPYLKIWSAGCSSGEEPYTISMVMSEFALNKAPINYSIFASDISSKMLKIAFEAVYKEDKTEIIPMALKRKYLLKSKNREERKVKICNELRRKITFHRLNLMAERYNTPDVYDIVFCRNVLIYFDRVVQEAILNKLCNRMKPGAYLFLGHSESVTGLNIPLQQIKPTIFIRK